MGQCTGIVCGGGAFAGRHSYAGAECARKFASGTGIYTGEILEYTQYNGNLYGTPKHEVDTRIAQGRTVILVIEVEGAGNIRKLYPEALTIFLLPPSMEELENRLRSRGTESEEAIQGRMATARREVEQAPLYTATLVNDDLETCAEKLYQMIREYQKG